MNDGIITHIQRMSIHDGPGIRSTIFLKGCNLRCQWCHNPETFSKSPEIEMIDDKCLSCGSCLSACQIGALGLETDKIVLHKQKCISCFECIDYCYPKALQKVGRMISAEEIFAEIEPDFLFFEESMGGITVSGGEPMMQFQFCLSILKQFHASGIHTAIETNMTASWEKYEQIMPYADLIMADIKLFDNDLHLKWTGGGNKMILRNILALDKSDKPYILRTPIIPGVNNNLEQLEPIFNFVSELKNVQKYELLAFHPLAAPKYKSLKTSNPFNSEKSLTEQEMNKFIESAHNYNIL